MGKNHVLNFDFYDPCLDAADFHRCVRIVESGLVSAGLPCLWLIVVGNCRFTRRRAALSFNLSREIELR